jgi:hypothetical protein
MILKVNLLNPQLIFVLISLLIKLMTKIYIITSLIGNHEHYITRIP